MIRIGVLGAQGRMGEWVIRLLDTEYKNKAVLGAAVGRSDDIDSLLSADVVIDFASPEAMLTLCQKALQHTEKLPAFVIGSTGWNSTQLAKLEKLAEKTPVLTSSNFSIGVLAALEIFRHAAPMLHAFGYTPVLVEGHHKHKKDSPSGTAISIQKALAAAYPDAIQTHSARAGEVIGDHEVSFYGAADKITIGHFAQDRSVFARGAIDVAVWLSSKKATGSLIPIQSFFQDKIAVAGKKQHSKS